MSQVVGQVYKSRIPEFSDDASIEEALKVYHYGVDNYTTQTIPNDSIEGNFRTLHTNLGTVNSTISALDLASLKRISLTADPNIITAQSTTTIPLTIRQIASQTSNLQQWENSTSTVVASVTSAGTMHLAGNLGVGTTGATPTVSLNIVLPNATQTGIVVKASLSPTGNLQEWQDSTSTVLASISSNGSFFSSGSLNINGTAGINGNTNIGGQLIIDGSVTSNTQIIAKLPVSSTSNIQEWQNSSGVPLSWITFDGRLYVQGNDINSIVAGLPPFLFLGT